MPAVGTPTLDQLAVFAAVADAGSFSAAARRLRRGQSVISYTIANLEAQLGVKLFDREGRVPRLTRSGQAVLADARRVAGVMDEMRARAAALQQGLEPEISLAVDVLFPVPRLVCALRDFSAEFPTVSLRLRMEAVGGAAQLVLDGVCGLGISGWAGGLPETLERRPAGQGRLIPVAAPGHPMAALPEVPRSAARTHVQLVLADASRLTEGRDFGVIALQSWRLGDLGAKHALLLAGLGWGNMPEHLVTADLQAGRLVRLRIEGEHENGYEYRFSLIHRSDRPPGRAGSWLRERLFFSEEKNQKTFISAPADGSRPWPDSWEAAQN
jgi:DNA-binding transcriptional LysR family regulator